MYKLPFATLILILLSFLQLPAQDDTSIDPEQIEKLIAFADSTYADGIMILHKGKVVTNWKSDRCNEPYYNTSSMCKSWTGLVVGLMIDKGLIKSEDDQVCKYLPDWKAGCENQVTIKHLLTMSAGFKRRGGRGILGAPDANAYALSSVPDTLPGIRFGYSNVSVQLLGIIMERLTGKSNDEYFKEVLFKPLGMDSTFLVKDDSGKNYVVYGGVMTTLSDAAKIGLLMKNKGKQRGKQFISESWVEKSTTPSAKAPYYGYLWWIDNQSENKNYAATGDLGKLTIVFPGLDLIFLRQQSCDKTKFTRMEYMGPKFLSLIASVVQKK